MARYTSQFGPATWPLPWGKTIGSSFSPPPPPPAPVILETPATAYYGTKPAMTTALQVSSAFVNSGSSPVTSPWQPYVDFFPQVLIQ